MAKKKIEVKLDSYGEYTKWDRESKDLPKITDITDVIEAEIDTEFGYTLIIKKAKGKVISFKIDHPPFKNKQGNITPPFTGEQFINSNNFTFYLGDRIWEPLDDKLGKWILTSWIDGNVIAHKELTIKKKSD